MEEIMELNLIGTLTMFKTMGMLPNFSVNHGLVLYKNHGQFCTFN